MFTLPTQTYVFLTLVISANALRNGERRLFDRLVEVVDPSARPVLKANETIVVNVSITLKNIMHMVSKSAVCRSQTITIYVCQGV